MKINKLMVVAHPDDETMFGGDELLQEKGWKVVCITEGDNPERSQEFAKAMEAFGAEYEIWTYKDAWTEHINRPHLEKDLRRVLHERTYEKIVTHNLQGEYGHPEHKAVSEVMHNLVENNLYVFDLSLNEVLEMHILRKKLEISEIYQSQLHAFEQLSQYWIKARSVKIK
ncbi:PIG-L family deacetylase [Aneurinibacillus sp. REN35]|uniref:PIG-L family deacetylase n=1 Tax=Aneurinibacillus sp. REN35 TaxID=3237286 RepID=UPI003529A505